MQILHCINKLLIYRINTGNMALSKSYLFFHFVQYVFDRPIFSFIIYGKVSQLATHSNNITTRRPVAAPR